MIRRLFKWACAALSMISFLLAACCWCDSPLLADPLDPLSVVLLSCAGVAFGVAWLGLEVL